jgi:hypothetical protein
MKPVAALLTIAILMPSAASAQQTIDETSFATFTASATANCDTNANYVGWIDKSPLRNNKIPYVDLGSGKMRDEYANYMSEIKAEQACLSETPTGLAPLDLAKCAYRETQNTLFNCYSVASKLKIAHSLESMFDRNGRAKDALKKKIEALEKLTVGDGTNEAVCNKIPDGDEILLKQDLLKNSTVQMCRYSYYLKYLYANAKDNSRAFITENTPQGRQYTVGNTEAAGKALGGIMGKIQSESDRAREVHRTATEAFMDMDRTYGAHLMLTLIYEDFVEIRDRLKSLFNPIGQFIYKASNAQSPYNR